MMSFDLPDLDETEDVLGVFYGGRGQVGGQLVVTNRRLLFGPVRTDFVRAIGLGGAGAAGVPGTGFVKSLLDAYEPLKQKQIFLRHVVAITPGRNAGWTGPPTFRLTLDTESILEYGIVASTLTPNPSPANNVARDRAIDVISRAVAQAKAGAGPA
jgi:hypothetical protein